MTTDGSAPTDSVGRLGELTRRYSRYSASAGGLSSVVGGALVLATYLIGALTAPVSLGARLALASAPIVWIVTKELLRRFYYQRLGKVDEARTTADRRWHLGFTLFSAVISAAVVAGVMAAARNDPATLADPGVLGYLLFVVAMPLLVWLYMKTPLDFIAGIFLITQAAVILAGGHYELGSQLQAPIAAVVLILYGLRQHLDFRSLERELRGFDQIEP